MLPALHPMDTFALGFASDYLRAEPVIVEVGANVGEWTRAAIEQLDPEKIVSFEPQVAAFHQLVSKTTDERFIPVLGAAGADVDRGVIFASHDPRCLRASLHRLPSLGEKPRLERVNVMTLDEVVLDLGLERVDYLKLDCEGGELGALWGARKLLARGVGLVQFEFNNSAREAGLAWNELWSTLRRLNYRVHQCGPDLAVVGEKEPPWEDCDYLAWRE